MKKILVMLFLMLFPVFTNAVVVTSKSAILMDEDTGRILYSKGIDDKRLIASTTKIMTAVLAIESGMLEAKIIVSDENKDSLCCNRFIVPNYGYSSII